MVNIWSTFILILEITVSTIKRLLFAKQGNIFFFHSTLLSFFFKKHTNYWLLFFWFIFVSWSSSFIHISCFPPKKDFKWLRTAKQKMWPKSTGQQSNKLCFRLVHDSVAGYKCTGCEPQANSQREKSSLTLALQLMCLAMPSLYSTSNWNGNLNLWSCGIFWADQQFVSFIQDLQILPLYDIYGIKFVAT